MNVNFLEPLLKLFFPSLFLWSFVNICSEGGGQHAGHHHSLGCGRCHRSDNGLHVAQELHSLCPCQDGGEKVGFHNHLDIYQQCNHFILFHQSTLLGLGSMLLINEASLKCFFELLRMCSSNFVSFCFPPTPLQ